MLCIFCRILSVGQIPCEAAAGRSLIKRGHGGFALRGPRLQVDIAGNGGPERLISYSNPDGLLVRNKRGLTLASYGFANPIGRVRPPPGGFRVPPGAGCPGQT